MEIYDTVLVGAGFFACGYAKTHENTLIIEQSQMIDKTFYGTMRGFAHSEPELKTAEARAVFDDFKELGVVKDGSLYVNALDVALCNYIMPDIPDILLGSCCTDIQKNGDIYTVSFVNNGGRDSVKAKKVIVLSKPRGNFINVLAEYTEPLRGNADVIPAFHPNQYVLTFNFPDVDINHAKAMAYERLSELLPEGAKALHMATYMYSEPKEPFSDENGVMIIDEFYYSDPFTAYESGVLA